MGQGGVSVGGVSVGGVHLASRRSVAWIGVAIAAAMLGGCKEVIVYNLTQKEAIEITVVLSDAAIVATTVPEASEKEPMFKLQVDAADALRAKAILLQQQLPKTKPRGLNEIFAQPSMIPTSTEEKARLVLGLQGDLAASLETVDNVVDAEVHVVLPEANPLQSDADRTEASAAVLVKYRPLPVPADEEESTRERWRQKERLLLALRDDLLKLKEIWNTRLVDLDKRDSDDLKNIELYLLKHVDDNDARNPNNALIRLKKNGREREGLVNSLQNLPQIRDLDGVLRQIDRDEGLVLPLRAASVRALVANSIPRLRENAVAVEFTPVIARKPPEPSLGARMGVPKERFLIVAGVAGVLAVAVIGLGVWVFTLQKKAKTGDAPTETNGVA